MADLVFVDTNVLIYARDRRDAGKRERAAAWLLGLGRANRARINLQVLNELTNWILRNERHRAPAEVQRELALLGVWGERSLDDQDVEIAWSVRERLGYQWFDCLLVAAAHNAGCRYFLTEDMAHGATFAGLTLIDPFQTSPSDVLTRN